jgi:hypothetical protein
MSKKDEKTPKKTEEEYEKEYTTKIATFTKALEGGNHEKLILDLIDEIPRESKSEQLKVAKLV